MSLTASEKKSARRIVLARSCSKLADLSSSAKTVLTWLLGAVGAPPVLVGFLVPIRESGSMLPQAFLSGMVKRARLRKWVFVLGAAGQALCLFAMATAALVLNGSTAGLAIVGALGLHALARCLCSIASKDVLGKCVPKGTRGKVSGLAASVAGGCGLAGAAVFMFGVDREVSKALLAGLLVVGGVLYGFAAGAIASVDERPSIDEVPVNLKSDLRRRLQMVWSDKVLRSFVGVRALLLGSALGSPYLVVLSQRQGLSVKTLAAFVFAGGLASALSAFLWGKWSDRSSRSAMAAGGIVAGLTGFAGIAVYRWFPDLAAQEWTWPLLFFVMSIGYEGVRIGRKVYIVDISEGGARTDYVSASNTITAVIILAMGALAAALQTFGPTAALILFSSLCLMGSALAFKLKRAAL
ncbi:MAG: hypothetical protein ACI9R3_002606 [Verrucomicrobiales bacterium]|jgi:hypothetical protein